MASRGGDKYAGVSTALGMVASGMEERRKRRAEFEQKVAEAMVTKQIDQMYPEMQDVYENNGGIMKPIGRIPANAKIVEPSFGPKQARQNFLDTTRVREEFLGRPEVKEYTSISTAARSMDSLLTSAVSGNIQNKVALDQGLITLYNKMTDPQSVVRESEYARTPENLPLANRFNGALQKVYHGGAGLTNEDRRALVWGAKVISNERGKTFNQTLGEYSSLAGQYGFDESLITRGMSPHVDYPLNPQGIGGTQSSTASLIERALAGDESAISELRRLGVLRATQ